MRKKCTACDQIRPLEEFHKKGNRLAAQCKFCVNESKKKARRYKKLSELGNAKRRTSLCEIKRRELSPDDFKKIESVLIEIFNSEDFNIGDY